MGLKDPVARAAYQKAYRAKNPLRYYLHNIEWRKKNSDRSKQIAAAYYARTRETRLAIAKTWRKENKLAIKVARDIGVSIAEARKLIGEANAKRRTSGQAGRADRDAQTNDLRNPSPQ